MGTKVGMYVGGEMVTHAGAGRLQAEEEAGVPERSTSRGPLLVHIVSL